MKRSLVSDSQWYPFNLCLFENEKGRYYMYSLKQKTKKRRYLFIVSCYSDKGLNGQYYESDNPFDKEKGTWNDGYTVPLREWE